jgi:hypothetical protein
MKISDIMVPWTAPNAAPLTPGCIVADNSGWDLGWFVEQRGTFAIVQTPDGMEQAYLHDQLYVFPVDFAPVNIPKKSAECFVPQNSAEQIDPTLNSAEGVDPGPNLAQGSDTTRNTILLSDFPPPTVLAMEAEGATRVACIADAVILHKGLNEIIGTDHNETWSAFDLLEEVKRRLAEGEADEEMARKWADEFMGPVSDAIGKATGKRTWGMVNLRERIIADYTAGTVGKREKPMEQQVVDQVAEELVEVSPDSGTVVPSPFYLCREKIRRAIDAVGGVVDEMEAAGVDGVRKLWEQGDEAACDLSDALDNLDRRWCDRASVAAAGGDA